MYLYQAVSRTHSYAHVFLIFLTTNQPHKTEDARQNAYCRQDLVGGFGFGFSLSLFLLGFEPREEAEQERRAAGHNEVDGDQALVVAVVDVDGAYNRNIKLSIVRI